jgi:hypothetical protein
VGDSVVKELGNPPGREGKVKAYDFESAFPKHPREKLTRDERKSLALNTLAERGPRDFNGHTQSGEAHISS